MPTANPSSNAFTSAVSWIGNAISSTIGSLASSAFDAIAKAFANAAATVSSWLWQQIDSSTAIQFGGSGFDQLMGILMGLRSDLPVPICARCQGEPSVPSLPFQ